MTGQRSRGRFRYLTTSSAQTSFTLTAGNKTSIYSANAYQYVTLDDARGFVVSFFGAGTANTTFDYRIYSVFTLEAEHALGGNPGPTDCEIFLYGHGVATVGTGTGAGTSTIVTSSEVYADGLTWVLDTFGTAAETAYGLGTGGVSTLTDNTIGSLFLPNMPGNGILIEFDLTGATAANAIIERIRG